jgi:DNA-3-methyladenine glycosylase
MEKLSIDWYLRTDVVQQARELLGKVICTNINGQFTAGIITETEAYAGEIDRASHAFGGKKTARTATMYQQGGIAYIYLCYGMHHLFNVVTAPEGIPHAVLLRGIQPLQSFDLMRLRRKNKKHGKGFSDGPATAAQALGLHTSLNGSSLLSNLIWLEDHAFNVDDSEVAILPRVGVDYAGSDALLPYRFVWKNPPMHLVEEN